MQQAQIATETTFDDQYQIIDEAGYLIDPYEWSRDYTRQRAAEQRIDHDERHWMLIDIIRDKYLRLGSLPPMRSVCKAAGFNKFELKMQFGNCLNLWKMAGLPNPGDEARAYMN